MVVEFFPIVVDPEVVIFTRNKKHWDMIDENLVSFDTQPDWKPDNNS